MTTTTTRQYRDTQVDVKLVLSALWIAMLFVFAYVDIFESTGSPNIVVSLLYMVTFGQNGRGT